MNKEAEVDSFLDITRFKSYDPKHWVNKEQQLYLKRKIYEKIEQNVVYAPDFLDEIAAQCESCGKEIDLDFLKKRPPCMPFFADGSIFQPGSTDIICNHCGNSQYLKFEMVKYENDCDAFGDEAFREHDNKVIVSFTLICLHNENKNDQLKKDFYQIKRELCPELNPDSWCLHIKDIWSSDIRKKRPEFAHITKEDIGRLCSSLSVFFKKYDNELMIYNSSGVYFKNAKHGKKALRAFKERCYYPLLMRIFYEGTKTGFSPHLYFEDSGDDGWAKNLFKGGRLTLMWPILTHGIPISSPKFVGKNYDYRLELADFTSFVIARFLYLVSKRACGEMVDFDVDPSWLSKVRYLGFRSDGYCMLLTDDKYPLNQFFKGTKWASS